MDKKEKNKEKHRRELTAPVDNNTGQPASAGGGIIEALQAGVPQRAGADEERLVKLARVNAFGNFMKHLGAFAGHGYAPVEKAPGNAGLQKVFGELKEARAAYRQQVEAGDKRETVPGRAAAFAAGTNTPPPSSPAGNPAVPSVPAGGTVDFQAILHPRQ